MQEKSNGKKDVVHPVQKFLDNPWLLLALGLAIPILSYTIWGLFELLSLDPARLP